MGAMLVALISLQVMPEAVMVVSIFVGSLAVFCRVSTSWNCRYCSNTWMDD